GKEPSKPQEDPDKENETTVATEKKDYTPTEMMKTGQFWSLWFMYAFSASAGLIIIGHVATIASIQGGLQTGFLFVALLAVGNAAGRLISGAISDRLGRTATLILVFVFHAINFIAFVSFIYCVILSIDVILISLNC